VLHGQPQYSLQPTSSKLDKLKRNSLSF